jgi:hypothetical protein
LWLRAHIPIRPSEAISAHSDTSLR